MGEPTEAQINDACMWYRHDFGLLQGQEREMVRFQAKEWLRAWGKAIPAASSEDTAILRTRVENQATEIARLMRIVQMQPPRAGEDVRAGALAVANALDAWADAQRQGRQIDASITGLRDMAKVVRALIPGAKP